MFTNGKSKFSKNVLALISILLVMVLISSCGVKPTSTSSDPKTKTGVVDKKTADGDKLDPVKISWYYNNTWETIRPWGDDAVSKFLKEKFNIEIDFYRADSDAEAKLNIMISSGDLPEVITTSRDANFLKMADLGLLQSIDPLIAVNPAYNDNVKKSTQDMLRVNGELYTIPLWARANAATGGNMSWMYNKRIYEACGSPDLTTFEGLYNYAVKAKELGKTKEGFDIIPYTSSTDLLNGEFIMNGFFRSTGAPSAIYQWYAPVDGKLSNVFIGNDKWKAAALEANKWFREGLISETNFSDTRDQLVEKQAAGRVALMYYDFSLDNVTKFRQMLTETYPDDEYVVLTEPAFPPANGVDPKKVYGEFKPTSNGDGINFTTKFKTPQRVLDMCTFLMSKEGAIVQMYGPQGAGLWNEKNSEGNPILLKSEGLLTEDEAKGLGLWYWMIPGQADSVDETKFAVNAALPENERSFVVNYQANVFTALNFLTDEFFGLKDTIKPTDDLGIQRQLCDDRIVEQLPKIIMASSEAEAIKVYDDLVTFLKANGVLEVMEKYNERYQANVKLQGFTAYDR